MKNEIENLDNFAANGQEILSLTDDKKMIGSNDFETKESPEDHLRNIQMQNEQMQKNFMEKYPDINCQKLFSKIANKIKKGEIKDLQEIKKGYIKNLKIDRLKKDSFEMDFFNLIEGFALIWKKEQEKEKNYPFKKGTDRT